ncbi:MAG: RDD family protein [Hymenobacter sp.]
MATIRIHTTQNVTLEYEVASLGDRIVATLIDYCVLIAWGVLWAVLFTALGSGNHQSSDTDWGSAVGIAVIIILVIIIAPYVLYFLLSEIFFNGQTIGKKARDLRVVRLDGHPRRAWATTCCAGCCGWSILGLAAVSWPCWPSPSAARGSASATWRPAPASSACGPGPRCWPACPAPAALAGYQARLPAGRRPQRPRRDPAAPSC